MSALCIVENQRASDTEWVDICKACAYTTYFHTPQWADIFSRYFKGKLMPCPRKIVFSDGKKAIVPLGKVTYLKGLLPIYVSSPAGTYGGWLSADNLTDAHANVLAKFMLSLKNIVWRENPYDPCMQRIELPGARYDFTQTFNLQMPFEQVLKSSSHAHEKAIKKAKREGIYVREAASKEDWLKHFEAYQASLSRWESLGTIKAHNAPYRLELFEMLAAIKPPHCKLWLALYNNSIAASIICFYWNKHAVAWHGAAFKEYFDYRPNNLLYAQMIHDAYDRGYHWFDCNPAGGLSGVVAFKDNLGAQRLTSRVLDQSSLFRKAAHSIRKIIR